MTPYYLSDELLDKMRLTGDVLADPIAELLWQDDNCDIMSDLKKLSMSDMPSIKASVHNLDTIKYLSQEDIAIIDKYFEDTAKVEQNVTFEELEFFRINAKMFDRYGYFITLILFFKSLPIGYMCPKPATVLHETKLLEKFAARRVMETAQFIFAVNDPEWYKHDNTGLQAIRKVRLLHAGMRLAIKKRGKDGKPWDEKEMGIPINQEDLALTNHLFSLAILEGLDALGIHFTQKERKAVFHTWQKIGQTMGICKELFMEDMGDAWKQYNRILDRSISKDNISGVHLTEALLKAMNEITGENIPMVTLEHATMYLVNDSRVWDSLGLHKPSVLDRVLNAVLHFILSWKLWQWLFHRTKNNRFMNMVNNTARKVLMKKFGLGPLIKANPGKNPLKIFATEVLDQLQKRDRKTFKKLTPAQRDRTFLRENRQFESWNLDKE